MARTVDFRHIGKPRLKNVPGKPPGNEKGQSAQLRPPPLQDIIPIFTSAGVIAWALFVANISKQWGFRFQQKHTL